MFNTNLDKDSETTLLVYWWSKGYIERVGEGIVSDKTEPGAHRIYELATAFEDVAKRLYRVADEMAEKKLSSTELD